MCLYEHFPLTRTRTNLCLLSRPPLLAGLLLDVLLLLLLHRRLLLLIFSLFGYSLCCCCCGCLNRWIFCSVQPCSTLQLLSTSAVVHKSPSILYFRWLFPSFFGLLLYVQITICFSSICSLWFGLLQIQNILPCSANINFRLVMFSCVKTS